MSQVYVLLIDLPKRIYYTIYNCPSHVLLPYTEPTYTSHFLLLPPTICPCAVLGLNYQLESQCLFLELDCWDWLEGSKYFEGTHLILMLLATTAVVITAAVTVVFGSVISLLCFVKGSRVGSIWMIVTLFPSVHLVLTISIIYSSPSLRHAFHGNQPISFSFVYF